MRKPSSFDGMVNSNPIDLIKGIAMSKDTLIVGDVVLFTSKELSGTTGIVSKPIAEERPGHVLIIRDGHIVGVEASFDDVSLADENAQGFAQLAYNLIKLGSHVIEKRLL